MKPKTLHDVQEWYNGRHVSTIEWNKPFALAKSIARYHRLDPKYPKGTYFKLPKNEPTKATISN